MSNKDSLFKDPLVIWSKTPIPYGTPITFLEEPKKTEGGWMTVVLVPPSERYEIQLNKNVALEKNFVVLRCWQSKKSQFSHYAVSAEQLEQNSQDIEDNIISLLQRI